MIKSFFILLASLLLFVIDINTIAVPYLIFVFIYLGYMLKRNFLNEVALALPFFGYSFCILISKLTGIINLGLLLSLISVLCFYRFLFNIHAKKLKVSSPKLTLLYSVLFLLILFSFRLSYDNDYQQLKIRLFFTWFFILIIAINSFDETVFEFNFEEFLIISFFFFVPHFSSTTDNGNTLSPKRVWEIYSVLDDGIRGHDFDIITATRISGVGVLAFIVFMIDFNIKKLYLVSLMIFFLVMIIICQTRQSIAALFIPIIILIVYLVKNEFKNYLALFLGVVISLYSLNGYLNYLDKNKVESRIVTNVEGTSQEGSGRERIWDKAIGYISEDNPPVGFGNFKTFVKAHDYPHNIFLEFLIEIGGLATILLFMFLIYILVETFKVLFVFKSTTKIELFLLLTTIYFFALAQFSVDISRNMMSFFSFALYLAIKENQINALRYE